jgi:hypothetical protein
MNAPIANAIANAGPRLDVKRAERSQGERRHGQVRGGQPAEVHARCEQAEHAAPHDAADVEQHAARDALACRQAGRDQQLGCPAQREVEAEHQQEEGAPQQQRRALDAGRKQRRHGVGPVRLAATWGSCATGWRCMRPSKALSRSSAFAGRREIRKSTDSGKRHNTTGIIAAVAKAPNRNTERQPNCSSSTAAMLPPIVAPMG